MEPTLFDANASIPLAETYIKFPEEGVSTQTHVVLGLSPSPRIQFKLPGSSPEIQSILFDSFFKKEPLSVKLPSGAKVEVNPYGQGLVPNRSLVTGLDTGEALHTVQFGIINFPDFQRQRASKAQMHCEGNDSFRTLQLIGGQWLVEIRAVPNHKKVHNALSELRGFGLTHSGSIRRSDGMSFPKECVRPMLEALRLFCSFARGAYCGLTMIVGADRAGGRVWEQWSVSEVEAWKGLRSWFDIHNGEILENLFLGFWTHYEKSQQYDHVRLALEWYLDSNAQKALHSSIVLTQAALERLSYETVGRRRSGEKEGKWIERALNEVGVGVEIPSHLESLREFQKDKGLAHGPHTVVKIRNELVHEDMRYGVLPFEVYRQARELGLWYVEVMLLKLFGYNGQYANRLTQEWPGEVEPVPWARASSGNP